MKKPERPVVDESKCFICQEVEPTYELIRGTESFNVCQNCGKYTLQEIEKRNRIKQALFKNDTRHMFEYTLGMRMNLVRATLKPLAPKLPDK